LAILADGEQDLVAANKEEGPGDRHLRTLVSLGADLRRWRCRTPSSPRPSSLRGGRWVFDLRQIQCVRDACRRLVHFCTFCDYGQIYCSPLCRERQRAESRSASKRRYSKSFDGRWATARRVARLRARRAGRTQNV